MPGPRHAFLLAAIIWATYCGSLLRAASYEEVLSATAKEVAGFLKDKSTSVVTEYRALPSRPGGGLGFNQALKDLLQPLGIRVEKQANFSLVAEFNVSRSDKEPLGAKLIASIRDADNRNLKDIDHLPVLDDPKDLAEVLGVSVTLIAPSVPKIKRADERKTQQQKIVSDHLNSEKLALSRDKSTLYSDMDGLYGIQVHVGGQTREFSEVGKGMAYQTFNEGDEYTIVLFNRSNQEVGVDLKIDGLNSIYFNDARRPDGTRYQNWIIAPHSRTEVLGWAMSNSRVSRFEVTPTEKSAAVVAGIGAAKVGIVTATFRACWKESDNMPTDEPNYVPPGESSATFGSAGPTVGSSLGSAGPGAGAPSGIGTGLGRETQNASRTVMRTFGDPRGIVVFRYDRPEALRPVK
jgi:hypothetical protein